MFGVAGLFLPRLFCYHCGMSRAFETIEIQEESPKFLVIGDSPIALTLVDNLLSGGAQVFFLYRENINHQDNLFQISREQIENISLDVKYVFIEKEQAPDDEVRIIHHLKQAKLIYLNPKSIKRNSIMIFSPLIYGPGMIDETFGFIALNLKSLIYDKILIFPENFTEMIKPVYFLDVVEMVEKAMFSMSLGDPEQLIFLEGETSISLSEFLGSFKVRIKTEIKVKYLDQKLTFHLPSTGLLEKAHYQLVKGISETADYLNLEIEKNMRIGQPIPKEEIPVISKVPSISTTFSPREDFVKNVYKDNIEFLENNLLLKLPKKKIKNENSFFEKASRRLKKIDEARAKIFKIRLKRPKIKMFGNFGFKHFAKYLIVLDSIS